MGGSDMHKNQECKSDRPLSGSAAYERLLEIILNDSDEIDMQALKACRLQMMQTRRKEAVCEANDLLRKADRPVSRNDMLIAMNRAIMAEVKAFESSKTPDDAVMLMAIVVCDAMLKNGPLSEEDD